MPGMRPADVYELTGVGDPRISPDGSRVAYQVWWIEQEKNEYRGAIWVAPTDDPSAGKQFTSGEKRDGAPRWSPDGRWLAFVSNRGAEKTPPQLYVMPADGGEPRKLTDGKEGVEGYSWSPDSSRIVFGRRVRHEAYDEEDDSKREPRRFTRLFYKLDSVGWLGDRRKHLFVVDVEGGADACQLTDGDYEDDDPVFTPDGQKVVFSSLRGDDWDREMISRLYEVSVDGGEPRQISGDDGSIGGLAFSPDGTRLAYRFEPEDGTFPRHTQIGVMNADYSEPRLLTTSLDKQCGPYPLLREPAWVGDRIFFTAEDRGNAHIYSVAADGSAEPELAVGGERLIGLFDVRGDTVAYTATTHLEPMELYVGETRATDVTKGFSEGRTLAVPERFVARNGDVEVDAWIVKPADFEEGKKYPLLLNIHGGPFAQYTTGFFDEVQVYSGGGYAVVWANPRGGSGRTEEWGRAIRGPFDDGGPGWGSVDYEDLMAVVDTVLERYDFVDPERLGVLGGSYGGFMTSWIVGHTNRFKAALSERAVNNMVSAFGSSDIFWVFERQFGAQMWEETQGWLDMSPTTYAKQIETPLLVMHSENDLRCNIEQGEHLFVLLRLMGKEVEMVRFPAESHELSRAGSPRHRVMRFEAILEWFDRYLK